MFPPSNYTCEDDYLNEGVVAIEPMTAKEIMDKDIEKVFESEDYIVEEKFDGVRANIQFFKNYCRVFSRRRSVVTGFYKEKSDNLPQIRDLQIPKLAGTVIDGELIIPNSDFKTVSSILNCLPVEAVERQISAGKVVFNAFDCLYFEGKNIMNLPLNERKGYLKIVIYELNKMNGLKYIQEVPYSLACFSGLEYYHKVVARGGEGIMIKDLDAPYEMKRTRGFQKLKKKLTRDVVILGFAEPTKEYNGKFPNDTWAYWEDEKGLLPNPDKVAEVSANYMLKEGLIPVTRNYYEGKIGAIRYGVLPSEELLKDIKHITNLSDSYRPLIAVIKGKKFEFVKLNETYFVEVGECEGMTDEEREEFTRNKEFCIGKVIEVECNEVFKDTGKMRHPRFIRVREDKSAEDCTWEAHINS